MDDAARISTARAKLDAQRAVLLAASRAGPPCFFCKYLIDTAQPRGDGPYCGHPAHTPQQFNPVSGALSARVEVPARTARSADGLCGPEGLLFERNWIGAAVRIVRADGWISVLRAFAAIGLVSMVGLAALFLAGLG